MSEENNKTPKRVTFISHHLGLTLTKQPVDVTRVVQGQPVIVREDQQPERFVNGELTINSNEEERLEFVRNHRLNGIIFEEVPEGVTKAAMRKSVETAPNVQDEIAQLKAQLAEAQAKLAEQSGTANGSEENSGMQLPEHGKEDSGLKPEDVTSWNMAQDYMKEKFGLTHREVSNKDKLFAEAEKNGVLFPNYDGT